MNAHINRDLPVGIVEAFQAVRGSEGLPHPRAKVS
jgi:hypothetical protein